MFTNINIYLCIAMLIIYKLNSYSHKIIVILQLYLPSSLAMDTLEIVCLQIFIFSYLHLININFLL